MALESIKVSALLPATPERVYKVWLSSKDHSAFTGATARVSSRAGARFSAWDGYIQGRNLELEPYRRIVQAWRTTDFPADSSDSRLEVLLEPATGGTRVTLVHADIPEGQSPEYRQGWIDYYLKPMKKYLGAERQSKRRRAP